MKKQTLAGIFLLFLFSFFFQTAWAQKKQTLRPIYAKGEVVEKKRKVGDFTGIDVKGNFTVNIAFGKRTEMRIEAPENIENLIETSIQENMLVISAYRKFISPEPVKLFITVAQLESIRANDSAWVLCDEVLTEKNTQAAQFQIQTRGGAKTEFTLDTLNVKVTALEGSMVILKGNSPNLTAEVEGGANLAAGALTTQLVTLSATSRANAKIIVEQELNVTVTDGATVFYKGRPQLKQDVKDGGKLRRL